LRAALRARGTRRKFFTPDDSRAPRALREVQEIFFTRRISTMLRTRDGIDTVTSLDAWGDAFLQTRSGRFKNEMRCVSMRGLRE
jgi:hypothetical protein